MMLKQSRLMAKEQNGTRLARLSHYSQIDLLVNDLQTMPMQIVL